MVPDSDETSWSFAGLAPESGLLLAEASFRYVQDPIKGNYFYNECRLSRFEPSRPDHEQALHQGPGPCEPWVLHRRHAIGRRWSVESFDWVWMLLTLDGSAPTREFNLDALLQTRLAAEGLTAKTERPQWVQGGPGQLLLVWPLRDGGVWVGSMFLPGLEFAWTRQVAGTLEGNPIADELGRLYLSVGSGRVVSLSVDGTTRWSLNDAGHPVAVFRDTLFLDDGTVRSTADGGTKYTWPVAPQASVMLSESHAAVVAPCGTERCTRVLLLRRGSGDVLTDTVVPEPSPDHSAGSSLALLSESGAVLVVQRTSYPDMMSSPFYRQLGVRRFLVREGQPLQSLGELLHPLGSFLEGTSLLHEGQWVAVERDSFHNTYNPPEYLMGVSTPGLRAPAHGWLTPRGNHAGGLAPE